MGLKVLRDVTFVMKLGLCGVCGLCGMNNCTGQEDVYSCLAILYVLHVTCTKISLSGAHLSESE